MYYDIFLEIGKIILIVRDVHISLLYEEGKT